jgi:hypothetical protein
LPVATIGGPPQKDQLVLYWEFDNSARITSHASKVTYTSRFIGAQTTDTLFFRLDGSHVSGPILPVGAVVTDTNGKVIGLAEPLHNHWVQRTGIPPPLITAMAGAQDLLSGAISRQSWAQGPVLDVVGSNKGLSDYEAGVLTSAADYEKMSTDLSDPLVNLGEPTAVNDMNFNNSWYFSVDGTVLVSVYPHLVDLQNAGGKTLAQARWVAIQWGRSEGKPNRLIYGTVPYVTQGGFEINGDITNLVQSVGPLR